MNNLEREKADLNVFLDGLSRCRVLERKKLLRES